MKTEIERVPNWTFSGDSRLAKLSLVCLRKLSIHLPARLLSALAADEADRFCRAFALRLRSSPTSAFSCHLFCAPEEPQLRVFALQLLAVAVEAQPALADKLLRTDGHKGLLAVSQSIDFFSLCVLF